MSKEGKLRMDLIDPWFVEAMVKVCELGVEKYGEDTWKTTDPKVFLTAAERHILEMKKGHVYDPERMLPHAAHVAVNMMYYERAGQEQLNKHKETAKCNMQTIK